MTIRIVILEYCYDPQNNHWGNKIVGVYSESVQALYVKEKIEQDILPWYKEVGFDPAQVVIKEYEIGGIEKYTNLSPIA